MKAKIMAAVLVVAMLVLAGCGGPAVGSDTVQSASNASGWARVNFTHGDVAIAMTFMGITDFSLLNCAGWVDEKGASYTDRWTSCTVSTSTRTFNAHIANGNLAID